MYIADLVALIDKRGFCPHLYADDKQIYGSNRHSAVNDLERRLSACIDDVYSALVCHYSSPASTTVVRT